MPPHKTTHGTNRTGQTNAGAEPFARVLPKKSIDRSTGSAHLAKRSDLASVRSKYALPGEILIIDDEALDAERLTATLRVLFGYQMPIRWASSLGEAIDSMTESQPSLTFLDDILKPSADAFLSIPESASRRLYRSHHRRQRRRHTNAQNAAHCRWRQRRHP